MTLLRIIKLPNCMKFDTVRIQVIFYLISIFPISSILSKASHNDFQGFLDNQYLIFSFSSLSIFLTLIIKSIHLKLLHVVK